MIRDVVDLIETESNIMEDGLDSSISDLSDHNEYHRLPLYIRRMMEHPVLSKEQEQKFFYTIQNGASDNAKQKAREQLIVHNQRLILSVAKPYYNNSGLELEDLIQDGNLGLMTAIDRFDLKKNNKFWAFCV